MTDEREARLPKWARDELSKLRMQNRELRDHLAEKEVEPGTLVVTDPYSSYGPRPVGKAHESVRFYSKTLDGRDWLDVRVNADGTFQVMGSESFAVLPQSGNVVQVNLTRRLDR